MFDNVEPRNQRAYRVRAPRRSQSPYRRFGKRLFDVLFVVASSPIVLPVTFILAVIVRLDGGPALFAHRRVGKDGSEFKCYKIRTMVPDAESRLIDHLDRHPEAREAWERDFKLADDPRITPLGRILRKTSLDELPQFLNVLRGDMSVVGPRPVTTDELPRYGDGISLLLSVRPGVTGPWQVQGRNETLYNERVGLDLAYCRNHAFGTDLRLIVGTVWVVIKRTGV
jgi:lipopolysaccharide/colanic/teichoic acid biosynthesis glycosyltransferase